MSRSLRAIAAVVVVAALGCSKDSAVDKTSTPPTSVNPEASRPRPPVATATALLVGVVHRQGAPVCVPDGTRTWINLHHEIGFVPVLPAGGVADELAKQLGKPVVAHGSVSERGPESTEQPPADAVECPMEQMREDWVRSPDGMRMRRGNGLGIAGFAVQRVEAFEGLSARVEGDELHIELKNTLGVALDAPVTITVHYEGCYGKPGSAIQVIVADKGLAPGEVIAGRLPTIVQRQRVRGNPAGTSDHAAYTVEIQAAGKGVHFDFDHGLSLLGATVACPDRK